VYGQRGCAVCHGAWGEGNVGPRLKGRLAGERPERIVQRMWNHAPLMGAQMKAQGLAWPRLEAAELADLLAFLASGTEPGAPARPLRDGPR
jgi:mono/diheme cytochrome c family protein